ncbi:hypothetical protein [Shewanella surugensis]|uniref:Uncharacterized protein n=1 Tax=Shewanella surugensis TaxID=212020 RepID=A0ABT0LJC9_9GAMM|nr:hypothetical protein [Shewanella surugensis]MCL1127822.1 hypothetical protein [Shewanella surugensis]
MYCIANLYGTYNSGTSDGIYYQSGGEWCKVTNFHEDRVNCFTDVDGVIYAGTSESLYYQGTGSWEKANITAQHLIANNEVYCITGFDGMYFAGELLSNVVYQ